MDKIPSVDLRDFLSDNPERKQKFVNEIGKAYEEIGFVALKGHFLDDNLVDNLYGEVRNFFELPLETKQKYEIPGIGGQRGYVGFGKETAKGFKKGDLKEFWHFGQYLQEGSKYATEYPDNVIVDELPKFNEVGKETYQMLEKTGQYVLRALALHLDWMSFTSTNILQKVIQSLDQSTILQLRKSRMMQYVLQHMEILTLLHFLWEHKVKVFRFKTTMVIGSMLLLNQMN